MEIILALMVFLSISFFVWGMFLIFQNDGKKIDQRLKEYTQPIAPVVKVEKLSGKGSKDDKNAANPLLKGVKAELDKKGWIKQLEIELEKADIPIKGSEMALVFLGCLTGGIFLGWVIMQGILGGLIGGFSGYIFPQLFIRIKQKRRLTNFNMQINDCLTLISNSLKAGYSFFQAIDLVSREMPEPISREFARVLKEMNLGASTEEALSDMVKRVGSDDLDMVVQAVIIQRQVGGNLAEVLDKIAFTIRERIRIKAEIKTITAQSRMSGIVIALMPVGLSLLLGTMNPEYFSLLWTTLVGKAMIVLAIVMELIGLLVIRKIVNIRI